MNLISIDPLLRNALKDLNLLLDFSYYLSINPVAGVSPSMSEYRDVIEMMRAVRRHVRTLGHQVLASDDPKSQMYGYICGDCPSSNATHWICSSSAIHGQSMGGNWEETVLIRRMHVSHADRERLTLWLNSSGNLGPIDYEEPTDLPPDLWDENLGSAKFMLDPLVREEVEARYRGSIPTRFQRKPVI